MLPLSTKIDSVMTELETKKDLIKYRELELPKEDPHWAEIDRVYKHSEAKVYCINTMLTLTSRHVQTLKHSCYLEQVVQLVKIIRAIQAILAA